MELGRARRPAEGRIRGKFKKRKGFKDERE